MRAGGGDARPAMRGRAAQMGARIRRRRRGSAEGRRSPPARGAGDARAGGRRRKRGRGTDHPLFTGGISLMNSGCRFVLDSYLVDPARSHMLVSKIKAGETSGRGGSAP